MPRQDDPNKMRAVTDQLLAASDVSRRTREDADRLIKSFSRVYKEWEAVLREVQQVPKNDPLRLKSGLQDKLRNLDRELDNILNRGRGLGSEFEQILQRNIERTKQLRALEERVKTSPAEKAAVENYLQRNNVIRDMAQTNMNIREHMAEIDNYKRKKMDVDYLKNLKLEEDIAKTITRNVSVDNRMRQEMEARRKGEKVIHQPTPAPSTVVPKQSSYHSSVEDGGRIMEGFKQSHLEIAKSSPTLGKRKQPDSPSLERTKKKVKKAKIEKPREKAPERTLNEGVKDEHARQIAAKIDAVLSVDTKQAYLTKESTGFAQKSFKSLTPQQQDAKLSPTRKDQLRRIQREKDGLNRTGYTPDVKAARLYEVLAQVEKEIKKEFNVLPSRLLKQVQGEMQDIASKFPSIKLVEGKSKMKDIRKPKA